MLMVLTKVYGHKNSKETAAALLVKAHQGVCVQTTWGAREQHGVCPDWQDV